MINQARGTYTTLPKVGDEVACGDVLYRVDDRPVLLLCGTVPVYRDLRTDDAGNDVRQLNRNLHTLGYDAGGAIDPSDNAFTPNTQAALEALQHDKGLDVTGAFALADVIFLPEPARIVKVVAEPGGAAQPGVLAVQATSDTPEVHVDLDASQQGAVKLGDHAQITLPGNKSVTGQVDRLGTVAETPPAQEGNAGAGTGAATLPAYIRLDDPGAARGLDRAPVQVEVTTEGVENVLNVPVTAIVGRSGGGFAVEVVRDSGQHELVAVTLGLFDTTAGRVAVAGDVREGDSVVVPSV